VSSLTILGHIVSSDGLCPDPDKVQAVRRMRYLRNILEIRSRIALLSHFRKFLSDFDKIAEPLSDLTKKGFLFETPQTEAFDLLQSLLTSEPL
jgi:hypothetical protein